MTRKIKIMKLNVSVYISPDRTLRLTLRGNYAFQLTHFPERNFDFRQIGITGHHLTCLWDLTYMCEPKFKSWCFEKNNTRRSYIFRFLRFILRILKDS